MRVLVMGSGGVGGYYGGLLAHADNDVTFVARGAHGAAIRERGLEVRTQGKTLTIRPAKVVGSPGDVQQPPELALFTVKTYDTAKALEDLRPAVGASTAVLTLQNGVDGVELLSKVLGAEHVLAGVTYVASSVIEPGVVNESGFSRRIIVGEPAGGTSPRAEAVVEALRQAGADVELSTNAQQTVWDKFVLVAPHATISALCQTPIGVTRETPEAMALYKTMIEEVKAVGETAGYSFAPDIVDRIVQNFMGAPPDQVSSLQRDYAAQRRVELEYLPGAVVRKGKELGVSTPCFTALYAVLKVRARMFGGLD